MIDDPIAAHYELGLERNRLFAGGEPRLELTRTLELLDRFLPPQPARLIDIGGGPGAYAAVMARRGYDVHLYDLLDLHVQQARQAADAQPEHRFTQRSALSRDRRTRPCRWPTPKPRPGPLPPVVHHRVPSPPGRACR